jgi:tetratricopeptide (TPR) repeat protein
MSKWRRPVSNDTVSRYCRIAELQNGSTGRRNGPSFLHFLPFLQFCNPGILHCLAVVLLASACSSARPAAIMPSPRVPERLAEADRQVRAGCLDCLIAAYGEYDLLRTFPFAREAATAGAVRSAALIALRQRELGMVDEGYRQRARSLLAGSTGLPEWLTTLLDVIDVLPASGAGMTRVPTSDIDLERARVLRINYDAWSAKLRELAANDESVAYVWLAFMCGAAQGRSQPIEELLAAIGPLRDTPLIGYKRATCRGLGVERLEKLYADDPRFVETRYELGLAALGSQKLDDAEKRFEEAYAWRTEWPALTQAMANVSMTAEDFERSLTFYTRTLEMEPHAVDALLGKVRALTYLGRAVDAIATTDQLLAERWYVGDARYWRALNEAELQRNDEAWDDVEAAAKLVINADVPKLAGIIAYRRQQLDVSRARFEVAMGRNQADCETAHYLGIVLAELRDWSRTADVLIRAGSCLERAEQRHREEIDAIRASADPPARKESKIARREQYIAKGQRQRATSWFDVAVAYYNLSRNPEARQYAERVVDDEQFGERAKEILSRLK